MTKVKVKTLKLNMKVIGVRMKVDKYDNESYVYLAQNGDNKLIFVIPEEELQIKDSVRIDAEFFRDDTKTSKATTLDEVD